MSRTAMRNFTLSVVVIVTLQACATQEAAAESWSSFSSFIAYIDCAAQCQHLVRDGKVIGTRIVHEYWRSKDFDEELIARRYKAKAWLFSDYNWQTDTLTTTFEFYGSSGQVTWAAGPINGTMLYPGITTDGDPGAEVACSVTELHELLLQIGQLKAKGKPITGLPLPRFGSLKPAVP